jgi:hypothetical protein
MVSTTTPDLTDTDREVGWNPSSGGVVRESGHSRSRRDLEAHETDTRNADRCVAPRIQSQRSQIIRPGGVTRLCDDADWRAIEPGPIPRLGRAGDQFAWVC